MTRLRVPASLLLAASVASCSTEADPTVYAIVSGRALDADTMTPLPRVTIVARAGGQALSQAVTSSAGTFRLEGLKAALELTLVASSVNYETAQAMLRTEEGENSVDVVLRRSRVCRPGDKRCTTPPVAPGVLTCNALGTAYTSSNCGEDEICQLATTRCEVPTLMRLNVGGTGVGRVSSEPPGLACPPQCEHEFPMGTAVTLTATATGESRFGAWGGACMAAGMASSCMLTAAGNQLASARFDTTEPGVSVVKEGSGRGVVRSDPPGVDCGNDCGERFATGSTVRLEATAQEGGTFEGWSRGCDSVANGRCVVMVSGSRAVVARFEASYLSPLGAGAGCRWLLRFEGPERLASACGMNVVATASGAVDYQASRRAQLGSALTLDGLGFVTVPRPALLDARSTLELSVLRSGEGPAIQVLISDRAGSSTASPGVDVLAADDGRILVDTVADDGETTHLETMPGALPAGTWTQIRVSFDPAQGLTLRLDGQVRAEAAAPIAISASPLGAWLGGRRGDGGSFRGRLDEVRLTDR